jgi:hypothetical protein
MKIAGHNDAHDGNVAGHGDPRTTKIYTHFSVEETKVPLQALAGKSFLSSKEAIGVQSLWIKK